MPLCVCLSHTLSARLLYSRVSALYFSPVWICVLWFVITCRAPRSPLQHCAVRADERARTAAGCTRRAQDQERPEHHTTGLYGTATLPRYVKNKAGSTGQTVPGPRIPGHWPTPVPEALAVAEPVTLVSKTIPFSFLSPPRAAATSACWPSSAGKRRAFEP